MDGPAQVLHGLIDAQAVLSSLRGSKAVMLDLQPAQHSHAAFGHGVALDPLVAQIGRHPLEVLFEEADDLLERLGVYPVHGHLLQCRERCAGLLLIGAVLEDAPHAAKERAQTTDLRVRLDDTAQLLFLLLAHALFSLEQDVALVPEALGQSRQFLLIPRRAGLLASSLMLLAALDRPCPELTPGVLHDMEIVMTLWLPLPRRPSEWRCSRPCSHRCRKHRIGVLAS